MDCRRAQYSQALLLSPFPFANPPDNPNPTREPTPCPPRRSRTGHRDACHEAGRGEVNIPEEFHGWWRIIETSTWIDEGLDLLGPALISFTGQDDRLRMHCLLAQVQVSSASKDELSFTWQGAWEYDQMQGAGEVWLVADGRLEGGFGIENGDDSTFVAVRAEPPEGPIPDPPSHQDKWRRRR